MFITSVKYDDAAQFVETHEVPNVKRLWVGEVEFVPCLDDQQKLVYVMFDPMGSTAILGDGDLVA